MKIIIGIGNPDQEYENTRHNLGFRVLDKLAERLKLEFKRGKKYRYASTGELYLVKPWTYVNLTGAIIPGIFSRFEIANQNLFVICDDFNLPLGTIRIRKFGSSGGHNGLESIIEQIGEEFPRLRIGISLAEGRDPKEYVLERFSKSEMTIIKGAVDKAAEAVSVWANEGIEKCMNKFNIKT